MSRSNSRSPRLAFFLAVFCAAGLVCATDPPNATLNPKTGDIEITDTYQNGGHSRVRYVVEPAGGGTTEPVLLTDPAADDRGPRVLADADGNTWVVWWRDAATPEVLYRMQDQSTGAWSAEARISDEDQSSRHPEIALDGSMICVSYEATVGSARGIFVGLTDDGPEPFPTLTSIATTTFSAPDPLVQATSGHLWVSWVDSSTVLKWAEYDHDAKAWATPQSTSYSGSSVDLARKALWESFY